MSFKINILLFLSALIISFSICDQLIANASRGMLRSEQEYKDGEKALDGTVTQQTAVEAKVVPLKATQSANTSTSTIQTNTEGNKLEKPKNEVSLNQPFTINFGQEIIIKDEKLAIKFISVVEDSRCPEGMDCVWAGNARILIMLNGFTSMEFNTAWYSESKFSNYKIKFITLSPKRNTKRVIKSNDYVATLLVTKE